MVGHLDRSDLGGFDVRRSTALLDSASTGIVLLDAAGRFLYRNAAARSQLVPESAVGLTDLAIGGGVLDMISEGLDCESPIEFEMKVCGSEGHRDLLVSGRPVQFEGGDRYMLELVDVSVLSHRESSLRRLLLFDGLTGIASRRHFFELGEEALANHKRYDIPLTVGMLDVDDFKQVNDTSGHGVGDLVLVNVASCCASQLRTNDTIGRLGGDEFGLILPSTGIDAAAVVADRLRSRVFEMMKSSPICRIPVTVSLGLALVRHEDESLQQSLERADRALYRAKAAGRNRTLIYDEAIDSEICRRGNGVALPQTSGTFGGGIPSE